MGQKREVLVANLKSFFYNFYMSYFLFNVYPILDTQYYFCNKKNKLKKKVELIRIKIVIRKYKEVCFIVF